MIITLYKGVELRSDYSIVFDCDSKFWSDFGLGTPFERYLNTKDKTVRTIDNTYFSNDGVISIDWTVFDGDYEGFTYMKVESNMVDAKYFFVDSYEYKNEMLVLYYSLDIWHTYSAKMKIYGGVISRANRGIETFRRSLPLQYESNSALEFKPLETNSRFYLLAEYSVYALQVEDQIDDAANRYNYCSPIAHNHSTFVGESASAKSTLLGDSSLTYSISEVIDTINKLTAYQGVQPLGTKKKFNTDWWNRTGVSGQSYDIRDKIDIYDTEITPSAQTSLKPDDSTKAQRYEIIQFYVLPVSWFQSGINTLFQTAAQAPIETSLLILDSADYTSEKITGHFSEYQFLKLQSDTNLVHQQSITIPSNSKIVGIGFKSLFLPYSWNGLEANIELYTTISPLGFSLVMHSDQGLFEITEQFATPLPFTTQSATEKQLAVLARQQAKMQKGAAIASFGVSIGAIGAGIVGGIAGVGNAATQMSAAKMSAQFAAKQLPAATTYADLNSALGAATAYSGARTSFVKSITGTAAQVGQQGVGILYSANSIASANNALKSPINAGESNASAPNTIVNAMFGFGTYEIQPDNNAAVNMAIEKAGYNTFIRADDYHHGLAFTDLIDQYEPIQFAIAQVSGAFANDVRAALESILLGGAIISYSPDVYSLL